MYRPHNAYWLILPFLVCAVWFAVQSVRCKGKLKRKMVLPWVAAVVVLLLINIIAHYDDLKLLEELRGIRANGITTLTLSQGNRHHETSSPSEIASLISAIQSITNVAAHHSGSENIFDLRFDYNGHPFHYQIGRDTKKPDEYWVDRITNETEGLGPTVVHGTAAGLEKLLEDSLNRNTGPANP